MGLGDYSVLEHLLSDVPLSCLMTKENICKLCRLQSVKCYSSFKLLNY
jgi:hypothetical protein